MLMSPSRISRLLALTVLGSMIYRNAETGEGSTNAGSPVAPTEADAKAAAKAAKDAEKKAAAEKAKAEKAAAKEKEKADKKAAADKLAAEKAAAKVERNGVTRPLSGATLKVWQIADAISMQKKAPATRAEVIEAGGKENPPLNAGTINTQFGKWAKFNGVVSAKPAKAEKAAETPAPTEAAAA